MKKFFILLCIVIIVASCKPEKALTPSQQEDVKIKETELVTTPIPARDKETRCTDTDSRGEDQIYQIEPGIKGRIYFGGEERFADTCVINQSGNFMPVSSCGGKNCYVSDGACKGKGFLTENIICPTGCRDGACVFDQSFCKEAIQGHNNIESRRVNLVFVGINVENMSGTVYDTEKYRAAGRSLLKYDLEIWKKLIHYALDLDGDNFGIFSVQPFKSNIDKFNFFYVNQLGSLPSFAELSEENVRLVADFFSLYCPIERKITIVMINTLTAGRYGHWGGTRYMATSWPVASNTDINNDMAFSDLSRVFVHEFGHAFGYLDDEYFNSRVVGHSEIPLLQGQNISIFSSPQTYGPTAWRVCREPEGKEAPPPCEIVETGATYETCIRDSWWSSLIGNGCGQPRVIDCPTKSMEVNCVPGGAGGNPYYFRPVYNTIMNDQYTAPFSFGLPNEKKLCEIIKENTGSAEGYCTSVFNIK